MGGNRIKWIIGAAFVFLVITAVLNNGEEDAPSPPSNGSSPAPAGPQRPEATGPTADSDTMTETLRTVQAQYGEQRRTNTALQEELATVRQQLAELEEASASTAASDQQQSMLAQQIERLQKRLDEVTANDSADLPDLGFGGALPGTGDDYQVGNTQTNYWRDDNGNKEDADKHRASVRGYVRLQPLVSRSDQAGDVSASSSGRSTGDALGDPGFAGSGDNDQGAGTLGRSLFGEGRPLATIPARSTLFDATAMTALIGRVPVSGQVVDPFPVKIIVGDDNLAANGHHIPGLRGIIFDGTARGDWTLGCVSVSLTGATYVFDDGTISHLNGTTGVDDSIEQGAATLYGNDSGDSIGYISDIQGTPCLSGTKITDAYKQAGITTILGGLQGWAQYRADAERTTTTGAGSGVVVDSVSGDKSAFSQYGLAATGLEETLQIFKDRFQDTFDAIYIPPGKEVALHIGRDLHIVHHSNAAKIVYDQDLGGSHALD